MIAAGHLADLLIVKPGSRVRLSDIDPDGTHGVRRGDAEAATAADIARLAGLQERIWAEKRHAILIVLQGIDTSGKDGTIRHVMSAFNPQGCRVADFVVPTPHELAHDYLWRVHAQAPARGEVAIFNRSQYESVLVERVHELVPEVRWKARYDEINAFEAMLSAEGTTILKFFLHIGREEQRRRLEARLTDPTKRWKFNVDDLKERERWDAYMAAYEDALQRCSSAGAPWYVVPANHKWFRNLAVGSVVTERLAALNPDYPDVDLPEHLRIV